MSGFDSVSLIYNSSMPPVFSPFPSIFLDNIDKKSLTIAALVSGVGVGLLNVAYQSFRKNFFSPKKETGITPLQFEVAASSFRNPFTCYQNLTEEIEKECSALEKKYELLEHGLTLLSIKTFFKKDFPIEDLKKLDRIEKYFSLMERIAVIFKKHHVFPEVSVSDFEVRISRIKFFFNRLEQPKEEIDVSSIVSRAIDRSKMPFVELIGNPFYVHLPRSGLPQSYHSPSSSQSGILDRLNRSGMFRPQDQISQLAARGGAIYTGFGISFDYCVFGKRCTLISLHKTEAQRREKAKELGLLETSSWQSSIFSLFVDPKAPTQDRKNQEWALDRFVRREILPMLYSENYAACHIPSEHDMVEKYKLPLDQIADRDFIVLYHRDWQLSVEETFKGTPFDEFKQGPRFKMRLRDMNLTEVLEKIEELRKTQHEAYAREDLEEGTKKVPQLIEYLALRDALQREEAFSLQPVQIPSSVSLKEIKED